MTMFRLASAWGVLALGLAAAGCHKSPTTDSTPDDEETATAKGPIEAPEDKVSDRAAHPKEQNKASGERHHDKMAGRDRSFMGGPEALFRTALDTLDLTDAQRTAIEEAKTSVHQGGRGDKLQGYGAMSKAVRSGTVDEKALQAEVDKDGAANEGRARMLAGLQKLHDTLSADQRKAVVADLEQKMDERDAQSNGREAKSTRGPLDFMLRGLTMTREQRSKIDAALAQAGLDHEQPIDKAAAEAKRKAALEAFAKDKFDGDAVLPNEDKGPQAHMSKMIKALAVVVPLLDDKQRADLADRLEQGPMRHEGKDQARGKRQR